MGLLIFMVVKFYKIDYILFIIYKEMIRFNYDCSLLLLLLFVVVNSVYI